MHINKLQIADSAATQITSNYASCFYQYTLPVFQNVRIKTLADSLSTVSLRGGKMLVQTYIFPFRHKVPCLL